VILETKRLREGLQGFSKCACSSNKQEHIREAAMQEAQGLDQDIQTHPRLEIPDGQEQGTIEGQAEGPTHGISILGWLEAPSVHSARNSDDPRGRDSIELPELRCGKVAEDMNAVCALQTSPLDDPEHGLSRSTNDAREVVTRHPDARDIFQRCRRKKGIENGQVFGMGGA
jgi:hypothetical protein